MRILYWIRTGNKFGSLEKYILFLAQSCINHGFEFILMNEIENTSLEFNKGLNLFRVRQFVIGETFTDPIHSIPKAIKIIIRLKPDIIQTNFNNPIVVPLLRAIGVPIIYQTYHSGILGDVKFRTRFGRIVVSKFVNRILVVSERVRNDAIRAGCDPRKISMIYLGIPSSLFFTDIGILRGSEPTGWLNPDIIKIITIGRFFPEKGMRYVVECAIEIVKKYPNTVWWLVGGEGPEESYCRKIVKENKVEDKILFLGERNDVPTLLSQARFQVVGSLREGLGLMVLEASASSIPTIGTKIGGLDEAILDGISGILVDPEKSMSLIEGTSYLLDNPHIVTSMGKSAKQLFEEKFRTELLISELIDIYEEDYKKYKNKGRLFHFFKRP